MGIVRKQSLIGSVVIYTGAVLGFITSGLLFPNYLTPEQIGLISLLVTYGTLFSQVGSLGFIHTTTRIFPYFRNKEQGHNGFFTLVLLVGIAGSTGMSLFYFAGKDIIMSNSAEQNTLFTKYAHIIIPLFISILFFNLFDHYTKVLYNATRGLYIKEVVLRIIVLFIFLLLWRNLIDFESFVYLYMFAYVLIMIVMLAYLLYDKEFHIRTPNREILTPSLRKDIRQVSFHGLLISAVGLLTLNIDKIMLEKLIPANPLTQLGIYTTCTYFASLIKLSSTPLIKISSVIVADAWKKKDFETLKTIYSKSSINQSLIGVFVFVGLLVNLDSIFAILPEEYEQGAGVIIFIGLFYLTDMFAGVKNAIIGYSAQYRVLSISFFILVVIIIILNLMFIPAYGIVGAACASFIAKLIFHIGTYIYACSKYKMQPFTHKHLLIILTGGISYIATIYIPDTSMLIANILIKSSVTTIVFGTFTLLFSLSEDVWEIFRIVVKKIT